MMFLGIIVLINVYQFVEPDLSEPVTYGLFALQVFSSGACTNLHFIIFSSRMNPIYTAIGLEFCLCFGNIVAAATPILAKMKDPVPFIAIFSFCILGLSTVKTFKKAEQSDQLNI